ncbi:hypothetical protein [Nocardia asteroides]|uniref:hypothetical protein n=1 Tax=Nocardia asteroides TaxID=1824 RepID=UPI0033CC7E75
MQNHETGEPVQETRENAGSNTAASGSEPVTTTKKEKVVNNSEKKRWYNTTPGKIAVWVVGNAIIAPVLAGGVGYVYNHVSIDFTKTQEGHSVVLTWEDQ